MGVFRDVKTQELIGPDTYYTDGIWVWPAYFPYYLKRIPLMQIDKDFVDYLKAKNYHFTIAVDFKDHENEYEMIFIKMLSSKKSKE